MVELSGYFSKAYKHWRARLKCVLGEDGNWDIGSLLGRCLGFLAYMWFGFETSEPLSVDMGVSDLVLLDVSVGFKWVLANGLTWASSSWVIGGL